MSVYILNGLQVGRRTGENYAILTLKIQSLGEAIKRTEVIITISCAKYGKELQVSEEKQSGKVIGLQLSLLSFFLSSLCLEDNFYCNLKI